MLIDLHTAIGELNPAALAAAVDDAGLQGAVLIDTHQADRLEAYRDALLDAGLLAFVGVKLELERGDLLLIPSDADEGFFEGDWSPEADGVWSAAEAQALAEDFEGVVIACHPYYRGEVEPMGDRVYGLKHLTAVECTFGEGRPIWDRLAKEAADMRGYAQIASCGGDVRRLGLATMVFSDQLETQAQLVKALQTQACWAVEFEEVSNPRSRPELIDAPAPRPRRDDDRGGRPRRDDDRGGRRGRRDDDRRGRRPRRD